MRLTAATILVLVIHLGVGIRVADVITKKMGYQLDNRESLSIANALGKYEKMAPTETNLNNAMIALKEVIGKRKKALNQKLENHLFSKTKGQPNRNLANIIETSGKDMAALQRIRRRFKDVFAVNDTLVEKIKKYVKDKETKTGEFSFSVLKRGLKNVVFPDRKRWRKEIVTCVEDETIHNSMDSRTGNKQFDDFKALKTWISKSYSERLPLQFGPSAYKSLDPVDVLEELATMHGENTISLYSHARALLACYKEYEVYKSKDPTGSIKIVWKDVKTAVSPTKSDHSEDFLQYDTRL